MKALAELLNLFIASAYVAQVGMDCVPIPSPCFEIGSLIAIVVCPPSPGFSRNQFALSCFRRQPCKSHESIAQKGRSMATQRWRVYYFDYPVGSRFSL